MVGPSGLGRRGGTWLSMTATAPAGSEVQGHPRRPCLSCLAAGGGEAVVAKENRIGRNGAMDSGEK